MTKMFRKFVIGIVVIHLSLTPIEAEESDLQSPVRDLMNMLLDPPAQHIWASAGYVITEFGERELWPTTTAGWREVAVAANDVAKVADVLATPGYLPEQSGVPAPDWAEFSNALREVAIKARGIAMAQDKQGLFDVGGEIYQACVACHDVYMRQGDD